MYNPTPWKDHVTNPSNCFNITKNDDGTYQTVSYTHLRAHET